VSSSAALPRVRHLTRARDLADTGYADGLTVADLAAVAHLSPAHFSREFRKAFGESPHAYLLSRRLERAATLLRSTDYSVADICMRVGLTSVGSFTTSFTRSYGMSPTAYRASFPPAASLARIPQCVLRAYGRPVNSRIGEDGA
jgi:AraC-like DNA-binding protein